MKKRKILLLGCGFLFQLLLLSGTLLAQAAPLPSPDALPSVDSTQSPFSGATREALLATNITAFKVNNFKASPNAEQLLEEFEILQSQLLAAEQADFLCDMLLDAEHYFFTHKVKQCLFLPQMGVQFAGELDTVNVLISFDCGMIRYYHGQTFQQYYINDQMDPLYKFSDDLFPVAVNPVPAAEETVAANTANPPGFNAMSYMPTSNCESLPGPFGVVEKPFLCKAPPQAIYYVLKEGEVAGQLPQIVDQECNLSINVPQICQLNNLTETQFKNLPTGSTLIVGYLSPGEY